MAVSRANPLVSRRAQKHDRCGLSSAQDLGIADGRQKGREIKTNDNEKQSDSALVKVSQHKSEF
jgi:hypothetical protein